MNTLQRLLSNAILSFVANILAKGSDTLLFIGLGRLLGPEQAGDFTLGKTYFTIAFTLSAWGLHELLIREVARHRDESGRYFVNYLTLRVVLTSVGYAGLLLVLNALLPYTPESKTVIKIVALAIFPEAILSICQSLFVAHERMTLPTLAALVNGGVKLGLGWLLLSRGAEVSVVAWVLPVGASCSLLVYIPGIFHLFRRLPQQASPRLDWRFSLEQLRNTPGFVAIGLFYMLDFQADTFLISLFLSQASIGWYGAAQTFMLGFWILAIAIRTALYPLMTRYQEVEPEKFIELYRKANKYLLIFILPTAAGITILAEPIILLVFEKAFLPAAAALQWSIWAAVFAFLNVPCTIMMLIFNRQRHTAWMAGTSMMLNIALNLWLMPRFGILGSAIARLAATFLLFLLTHLYVERHDVGANFLSLSLRPVIAVLLMSIVVWQLRSLSMMVAIFGGVFVYGIAVHFLGVFSAEDRNYLRRLINA